MTACSGSKRRSATFVGGAGVTESLLPLKTRADELAKLHPNEHVTGTPSQSPIPCSNQPPRKTQHHDTKPQTHALRPGSRGRTRVWSWHPKSPASPR